LIENRMSSARAGNVQLEMNQSLSMTAGPNLEDELNIDKNTLETLKDLYAQKEQAVLREDFDEAKRLKISIENLKNMST
jgi:hypothetical protein